MLGSGYRAEVFMVLVKTAGVSMTLVLVSGIGAGVSVVLVLGFGYGAGFLGHGCWELTTTPGDFSV